jgi:CubicO group peptidase (beta-lactamase class C family)
MTTQISPQLQAFADHARRTLHSSAAGVAVVTPNGDTTVAVSGLRRPGGKPVELTDAWHIGSTFKCIHALAYARLVESGRAEWGASVPSLFPDLASHMASGWDQSTVDQMFTCQAGMRANPSIRDMLNGWKDARPLVEQRREAAKKALAVPPKNRGKFVYSNLGYTVMGAAIDRIAEKPFEDVLEEEVFRPLGVTSAGWGPPPEIWGRGGIITLNGLIAGRGKYANPTDPASDNPALLSPAGRLHLSLADWAKIQRVFIDGGHGLVSRASIERIFTIPDGNRMSMGWAAPKNPSVFRGQQGSNGRWVATVVVAADRSRTAMLTVNNGRTTTLLRSFKLATALLQ